MSQHEAPRSLFCLTCRNQRESTCLVRQLTTKANQWKYVACLKISYILVSTDTISFFFLIHSCESCRILFKNNGFLEYLLSTFFFSYCSAKTWNKSYVQQETLLSYTHSVTLLCCVVNSVCYEGYYKYYITARCMHTCPLGSHARCSPKMPDAAMRIGGGGME